jgi:hypothetical protein
MSPFVVSLVSVIVAGLLLLVVRGKSAMIQHWKQNLTIVVGAVVIGNLLWFGSIFSWDVLKTVFDDHQFLVQSNTSLREEIKRISAKSEPPAPRAIAYVYRNEMSVSQVANLTEHLAGAVRQAKPIVFLITFAAGNGKFKDDISGLIVHACDMVGGSPCTIERPPDPKLEIDTGIPTPTRSGIVVHASESTEKSTGQYIASRYVLGSCYNAVYSDSKIPDSIKKAARLGPGDRSFVWLELGPGSPWSLSGGC